MPQDYDTAAEENQQRDIFPGEPFWCFRITLPLLPTCIPLMQFPSAGFSMHGPSVWCRCVCAGGALRYQSQPCNHRKWHAGVPSLLRRLAVILDCCGGEIKAWRILASSHVTATYSNGRWGSQRDGSSIISEFVLTFWTFFSLIQFNKIYKQSLKSWIPGGRRGDKNNSWKICHLV